MMLLSKPVRVAIAGIVLFGTLCSEQGFAQKGKTPTLAPGKTALIVSADKTGVILPTPDGFVVDSVAAGKVGVAAAYHPQGHPWQTASAVMYVNFSPRTAPGMAGVNAIIARDTQSIHDAANGTTVVASGSGTTRSGIAYKLVDFKTAGKSGARERIAYLNTPDNVTMLFLSAQSASGFQSAAPAYTRWVKAATYVSINPGSAGGTQ